MCWNRHKESKNTKLCEIGSGTKLYSAFLSLKVFRHEDRETQSFYADCFYIVSSQPKQRAAPVEHKVVWPRPALKVNLLLPRQELNTLTFSKSQNPQPTLPSMTSFTPPGPIPYEHLRSCLHLTNPCAKRKVLSLTKPKGKIYKTKSLGKYITEAPVA